MLPVADCAVGDVSPPGVQQAGQDTTCSIIYFIQRHQRVPGGSQLMLRWEIGVKIILHKCCKFSL